MSAIIAIFFQIKINLCFDEVMIIVDSSCPKCSYLVKIKDHSKASHVKFPLNRFSL